MQRPIYLLKEQNENIPSKRKSKGLFKRFQSGEVIMEYIFSLYSWNYSIGRVRFLLSLIAVFVIFLLINMLFGWGNMLIGEGKLKEDSISVYIIFGLNIVLWMYGKMCADINRLRDIGKPWSWLFLGFIPLLGQVLFLYLLFAPRKMEFLTDKDKINDVYIPVICKNCEKKYRVKNSNEVKIYQCKNCHQQITVKPTPGISKELAMDQTVDKLKKIIVEPVLSDAKKGKNFKLLFFVIFVILLIIILIAQIKKISTDRVKDGSVPTAMEQEENDVVDAAFDSAFIASMKPKFLIDQYNKTLQLDPQDADAYICRGMAYNTLGNYETAILDFNKAIELNYQNIYAYAHRGIAYNELGKHERAILDFNKAIELDPIGVDAVAAYIIYINRGKAYNELGKYERAILDFNKAIEQDPKDFNTYTHRGIAYNGLGKYETAIRDFNKAIELDPQYPVAAIAYINRGYAYKQLGNSDASIQDYDSGAVFLKRSKTN